MRVLGLEDEAVAFYDTVSNATIVSARSRMYWEQAAHRPLNIRPDVEDELVDEERMGPKFLRDFEQAKRDRERKSSVADAEGNGETTVKMEPKEELLQLTRGGEDEWGEKQSGSHRGRASGGGKSGD